MQGTSASMNAPVCPAATKRGKTSCHSASVAPNAKASWMAISAACFACATHFSNQRSINQLDESSFCRSFEMHQAVAFKALRPWRCTQIHHACKLSTMCKNNTLRWANMPHGLSLDWLHTNTICRWPDTAPSSHPTVLRMHLSSVSLFSHSPLPHSGIQEAQQNLHQAGCDAMGCSAVPLALPCEAPGRRLG